MREVTVPGLEITVPPNGAFMCATAKMMPKAHFLAAVVAPRGYGKSAITTSFIEKLHCVDRLIVISPSVKSNKQLLDRLKTILKPEDIYEDPNDISIIDQIIADNDHRSSQKKLRRTYFTYFLYKPCTPPELIILPFAITNLPWEVS